MKTRITCMGDVYFNYGYQYAKDRLNSKKKAMLTQKVLGVVIAALGAVSIPVLNMDLTAALIFVPLGIYLVFAKKNYLTY